MMSSLEIRAGFKKVARGFVGKHPDNQREAQLTVWMVVIFGKGCLQRCDQDLSHSSDHNVLSYFILNSFPFFINKENFRII